MPGEEWDFSRWHALDPLAVNVEGNEHARENTFSSFGLCETCQRHRFIASVSAENINPLLGTTCFAVCHTIFCLNPVRTADRIKLNPQRICPPWVVPFPF